MCTLQWSECFIATAIHSFVLLAHDDMECAHCDDQSVRFIATAIHSFVLLAHDNMECAHCNDQSVSLPPPFTALFCWHTMTWTVHTEMIRVSVSLPLPFIALFCTRWHGMCTLKWSVSLFHHHCHTQLCSAGSSKMTGKVHTEMIRMPLFRHHCHLWRKGGWRLLPQPPLSVMPVVWNSETATKTLKQQLNHWNSTKQQLKHWKSFWNSETVIETVKVIGETQLCLTVTCPFVWLLTSPALSYCNLSLCVTIDKPSFVLL